MHQYSGDESRFIPTSIDPFKPQFMKFPEVIDQCLVGCIINFISFLLLGFWLGIALLRQFNSDLPLCDTSLTSFQGLFFGGGVIFLV